MGSRGSVIPFFLSLSKKNYIPITDERMTRFMISLEDGIKLVWKSFEDMNGGEIYVKKIPSILVTDIAKAINEKAKIKIVGIRPGEKLHEQMIGIEDSPYTFEYKNYYKILPMINNWNKDKKRIGEGKKVDSDFIYSSNKNKEWMNVKFLRKWIKENLDDIGSI